MVFSKILKILEELHSESDFCILKIRPEKILVSKNGEGDVDPYIYDLSMASTFEEVKSLSSSESIIEMFRLKDSD
jgi:hypothetical protein